MRRLLLWLGFWAWVLPLQAQTSSGDARLEARLLPAELGFRFDDNVLRSPSANGKFSDGIYLVGVGAGLEGRWGPFHADLDYKLGADQYQTHSTLNNLKNDLRLEASAAAGDLNFFGRKELYFRNSGFFDFDYVDDDSLLGLLWAPEGAWSYGARYKSYSREYYDKSDEVRSRNFVDQAAVLSVQREFGAEVSLKLEGSYNNRQFERLAVGSSGATFVTLPGTIQTDETWTLFLNAHLYFASILQDIDLEEQRTRSNSYGFSNSVESVSWAGVVRPAPSLYLQLFFRLYFKDYDISPLSSPDLRVGFVDEDSQDLLSIRASWEWAPPWTVSLGVSRARSESEQPGLYYIKNILSAQVKRSF